jgi:hypothetical protein
MYAPSLNAISPVCAKLLTAPSFFNGIALDKLKMNTIVSDVGKAEDILHSAEAWNYLSSVFLMVQLRIDGTRSFPSRSGFYSVCMEGWKMLKKSLAALFGLVFAMALITPPKANAEVVVGLCVGARPAFGVVVARPRPYAYVAPAPYMAYAPGYVYPPVVYPGNVVVGLGYARPYAYRHEWRRGYGWRR